MLLENSNQRQQSMGKFSSEVLAMYSIFRTNLHMLKAILVNWCYNKIM